MFNRYGRAKIRIHYNIKNIGLARKNAGFNNLDEYYQYLYDKMNCNDKISECEKTNVLINQNIKPVNEVEFKITRPYIHFCIYPKQKKYIIQLLNDLYITSTTYKKLIENGQYTSVKIIHDIKRVNEKDEEYFVCVFQKNRCDSDTYHMYILNDTIIKFSRLEFINA